MIRNSILFLTLMFSSGVFGQFQSEHSIAEIAKKIDIDIAEIEMDLATYHTFKEVTLVVLPQVFEKHEYYTSYIGHFILVNNDTGNILSEFKLSDPWISDAMRLTDIKIQPDTYQLNKFAIAFSITTSFENNSRVNHFYAKYLSLFAWEGNKIELVLLDFPVYMFSKETDGKCAGTYEITKKNLKTAGNSTNQYSNLMIEIGTEITEIDQTCEIKSSEVKQSIQILSFTKGGYQ